MTEELLYLREYFKIMEDHQRLLIRCNHLLQHFNEECELIGSSRWRLNFIYKCCRDIQEDAMLTAVLLDELSAKYPVPVHLLED